MNGAISTYSFIPVRSKASEEAELVTQILFGETFQIIEETNKWAKIKMDFDNYEGWIDIKLIDIVSQVQYEEWKNAKAWIVPNTYIAITKDDSDTSIIISAGSRIIFNKHDEKYFSIGKHSYIVSNNISHIKNINPVNIASSLLHTSYLWGGCSFFGIDCSGLSQLAYKIIGIKLPRDASQQAKCGKTVSNIEDVKSGDLAFFTNKNGNIVHVGICKGDGSIIHASGKVRIDKLDNKGIFVQETKKYTHTLDLIKRINIESD